MTTFKEIRGKLIRTLDTDPTPATNYEGEIWYNKTIGVLKGSSLTAAAWSSGGNLNTARESSGAAGTQNAAVQFGGSPSPVKAATEEYNGSTWTSGNNMSAGRQDSSGAGTQTAALGFAGNASYPGFPDLTSTEEYDGTNWTSGGTLGTGRNKAGGAGTQTAALGFGGRGPNTSPTAITNTEEYNGTAWTAGGALGTARYALGSATAGSQTAALGFGGNTPPFNTQTDVSEEYDGTSWSAGGNYVTSNRILSGAGIQTAALGFGGFDTAATGTTALYDGSSWTTSPASLSTSRYSATGVGTQTEALCGSGAGGPTTQTATEEFTGAFISTKTLTTS